MEVAHDTYYTNLSVYLGKLRYTTMIKSKNKFETLVL